MSREQLKRHEAMREAYRKFNLACQELQRAAIDNDMPLGEELTEAVGIANIATMLKNEANHQRIAKLKAELKDE